MINNNGHQNSPCTFAEQLAAYLYDEIDGAEKIGFESHLHSCKACTDELSGFSVVRSSILEWRTGEFEHLATPAFALPAAPEIITEKRSWFAAIQGMFTVSPMQAAAFAAIAVLVISAGLFWFAAKRLDNQELAKVKNTENKHIDNQPVSSENIENPIPAPTINKNSRVQDNAVGTPKTSTPTVKSQSNAPFKISSQPAAPKTEINSTAPNTNTTPKIKAPVKNHAPVLDNDEDDEDNSLRLSDMFEEIGMNKSADNDLEEEVNNE